MRILNYISHYKGVARGAQKFSVELAEVSRSLGYVSDMVDYETLVTKGLTLQQAREIGQYTLVVMHIGVGAPHEVKEAAFFHDLKPPYVIYQHLDRPFPLPPDIGRNPYACFMAPSKAVADRAGGTVFSPSVDIEHFTPRRKTGDSFVVGFVGSLEAKLNQEFPENFARYKDTLIVGSGPMEARIRQQYPHLNLAGHQDDVVPFLQQMDVFAYPTRDDSFGIVLLEAAACGLPIVTFNVGGVSEIVHHGENGYLVNSWEEFHQRVEELRGNKTLREAMGEASRAIARQYRPELFIKRWRSILHQVLPEIAIVVTTHDRPDMVKRAIASARAQSYKCHLVVVYDICDSSPDYSSIEPLADVFVQTPKNLGISATRNFGFQTVRRQFPNTRYIAFLDDDDTYGNHTIYTLVSAMVQHPDARVAYGRMVTEDDDANRNPMTMYRSFSMEEFSRGPVMSPSGMLWELSLYDDYGGFDEALHKNIVEIGPEDIEYEVRLAKAGVRFAFADETTTRYRKLSNESLTRMSVNNGDNRDGLLYVASKYGVKLWV